MAGPRTYPHGVTCWIDTGQPDLEAAAQFYSGLFGWALAEAAPPGVPGKYLIATLDGADVAALTTAAAGPARWNTYVAVDDAGATADAVATAGGTVVDRPTEGPGAQIATCADPAGAEFGLWQAGDRPGAQVTNAPGSWNFSNLHTAEPDAAMAFYRPIFGWRTTDLDEAGTMIQVPGYGRHLASTVDPGILERQAAAPDGFEDAIGWLAATKPGEPVRWHVTFAVADRDETAATAERLGATVVESTADMWSRNALLRDPQGAEFTVSQFTPPDGW